MTEPTRPHTRLYRLNHRLVNKVRGPAKLQGCEHCGERQAQDWATRRELDSETQEIDPQSGFLALCRPCHRTYDRTDAAPYWKGRHHAPESIEKIRLAKLGQSSHTPDSRRKISEALRGRAKSPEVRKNMRVAQRARRDATPPAPVRHASTSGYRRGCRCDGCRRAQAAYKRTAYTTSRSVNYRGESGSRPR